MKQTKLVKHEIETEYVIDVVCNKCGDSCVPKFIVKHNEKLTEAQKISSQLNRGFVDAHGLIEQIVRGSFNSEHLDDMTTYTFSMCEKCLVDLFETFKIPVNKVETYFG